MSDTTFTILIVGALCAAIAIYVMLFLTNIKRLCKNAKHPLMLDPLADAKRKIDIIVEESSNDIELLYNNIRDDIYSNRNALYYTDLFEAAIICANIVKNINSNNVRKDYLVRTFENMKSQAEFEETLSALGICVDIYRLHIANIYLKRDA